MKKKNTTIKLYYHAQNKPRPNFKCYSKPIISEIYILWLMPKKPTRIPDHQHRNELKKNGNQNDISLFLYFLWDGQIWWRVVSLISFSWLFFSFSFSFFFFFLRSIHCFPFSLSLYFALLIMHFHLFNTNKNKNKTNS